MASKVSLVLAPWARGGRNELIGDKAGRHTAKHSGVPHWRTEAQLCEVQSTDRFQLIESLGSFQLLAQTLHRQLLVSGRTEVTQERSPVCPGCSFSDERSWLQISWWLALPTGLSHQLPFTFVF